MRQSTNRQLVVCFGLAVAASVGAVVVGAQYAAPPDAYSITEINSMLDPQAENMQIYRDGSKVVVEQSRPGFHYRTFYDLQSHQNYYWNLLDASAPCVADTFSGDWGDPFAMSADTTAALATQHAKPLGSATINGIPTKRMEADTPDGKTQVWVEEKYGLVIKWVMAPKTGQPSTMVEVKQLSLAKPAASVFVLPPACAEAAKAAAKAPHVPTEEEQIAAETGGNAQDFANAIMFPTSESPASKNSCTVLFKLVHAGSMEPITSGFQVALDRSVVDPEHRPQYVMGAGPGGRVTFSGGGLREETGQLQNGVLRIENAPPRFQMELAFGMGNYGSAQIYRQCFASETVLLYVVPAKPSDFPYWLWVKRAK